MLKVLVHQKIDIEKHDNVTFIRIEPTELKQTIQDIIISISDLSWIDQFNELYIRDSFLERAKPTIADIEQKLLHCIDDSISSDAGEYIVSELSRQAIIECLMYTCIPIAELFLKQKSGNPGFDFHASNDCNILIFGEAKYSSTDNAYGVGLTQVNDFIKNKKDIKDLVDLKDFFNNLILDNANKGKKGYAIAFSSKSISSHQLIKNIIRNKNYNKLLKYHEIILVAVNI